MNTVTPHLESDSPHGLPVERLKAYLDPLVLRFEQASFIENDPISVPHAFDNPRDQEIIGLFSALLAWGRRDIMLRNLADLCERFRFQPYAFIRDFDETRDSPRLHGFVHRTFNEEDAAWLCIALKRALSIFGTVEGIVTGNGTSSTTDAEISVGTLSKRLLDTIPEVPHRFRKHLADPANGSACKRLNMYFRWMVRPGPVDLGIWSRIHTRELILPLDVHTGNQARLVGLLARKANDWKAALELTTACRLMDAEDPCRYDYALFGTGAAGEMLSPVDAPV